MQSLLNEPEPNIWPQIAPLLDTAMAGFGRKRSERRGAPVFREQKSGRSRTGFGRERRRGKMRVNRALEKLRKFFSKRRRGAFRRSHCRSGFGQFVHAAPVGLAISVTATAAKGSAAAALNPHPGKRSIELMAWTKMKTPPSPARSYF